MHVTKVGSRKVVVDVTHNYSGGLGARGPQPTKSKETKKLINQRPLERPGATYKVGHYIPPREIAWLCGPSLLFGPAMVPAIFNSGHSGVGFVAMTKGRDGKKN